MRIGIIHLSDLHISSNAAIHQEKISALINSLHLLQPFEGVIIAFSGDIAGKGKSNEYLLASRLIGSLASELQSKYYVSPINTKIILAPGNHDMNREISPQVKREKVEEWYKNKEIVDHISDELNRMKDFYDFADQQKCFFSRDIFPFTRKVLPFINSEGEKFFVEANIFNSALFSSSEDNGIHFMPPSVFSYYDMWSPAQLSLSIMHHSPDWFWPEQKVKLQERLYNRSNLVFYGHEHYESAQRIIYNNGNLSFIQAGGAWWDQEFGFENSSYYASVFDSVTRKYFQYNFVWNEIEKFYEHRDYIEERLPNKHTGSAQLTPTSAYINDILSGGDQSVCSDFSKYFVFPSLQLEEPGDYDVTDTVETEEQLLEIIESHSQIMILGGANSGKTTLLKRLFLRLSQNYTVLLCGTSEIAGKKKENIIRETFQEIYGTDQGRYRLFEQQEKKEKIILIDDSNEIKPEHLSKLLAGLQDHFEHIVITGQKDDTTFDVREQICSMLELEHGICQLNISKFYANKRRELIEKLVILFNDNPRMDTEALVSKIDKALSIQNLSFKLDPDFIVKFTSYYCSHINELQTENVNVFSKVFEASIELSIMPHLRRETVGQIKTALSEIAYYIHFQKCHPISEEQIDKVIRAYAEKYEEEVSTARFFEIVVAANLLKKSREDLKYRFKNKEYLAYFAAMAVSRHFNEGDASAEADLTYIIEYSCFSINSTVLKYIAYTTENIRIIELLLDQAISFVKDWTPYDIDDLQLEYLKNVAENRPRKIKGDEQKKAISAEADREKELEKKDTDTIETIDIYDYDENSAVELNNQLIRATLQMNVIASTLPIFSHIMLGSVKRRLITALYEMPNRIFYHWASDIDEHLESLIDEFMQEESGLTETAKQEEKHKIKSALQRLSTNLLLNLYYTVARNSATPATISNLTRPDYATNTNSLLERMMLFEEVDDWHSFKNEAEKLFAKSNSPMVRNMILAMVYHILVWSSSLPVDQRHHLMDYFKFKKDSKNILIQNMRLK